MLKVVAKLRLTPEASAAAAPLIEELVAATVEEAGCINYNFCQENETVDSFAIIETWESKEALDAHMKTEHFGRLVPQLGALATGEITIAVFEVLV